MCAFPYPLLMKGWSWMTDIIVIGGGPAGMTAALYALRAGKSVVILEKSGFGGQITYSPKVENYPGIMSMSGNEFAERLLDQVLALGAQAELENVVRVEDGDCKRVFTEDGNVYESRALIIAVGVRHRMLGLAGETELIGNGISFCAVCDGDFYRGEDVCVAGGGSSALQEALLLSETCRSVTIVQDLPSLTGEKKLQDAILARRNVQVITGAQITDLTTRDGALSGLRAVTASGEIDIQCTGLFVAIGLIPENGLIQELVQLDASGYVDADEKCETDRPGVFCAGDCRSKAVRQLTTAAADGSTAAVAACRYIDGLYR